MRDKIERLYTLVSKLDEEERWALKQHLANDRFYGARGTIHNSTEVDVVLHNGEVQAVWFRCQDLPFKVSDYDYGRVLNPNIRITGVEIIDES